MTRLAGTSTNAEGVKLFSLRVEACCSEGVRRYIEQGGAAGLDFITPHLGANLTDTRCGHGYPPSWEESVSPTTFPGSPAQRRVEAPVRPGMKGVPPSICDHAGAMKTSRTAMSTSSMRHHPGQFQNPSFTTIFHNAILWAG